MRRDGGVAVVDGDVGGCQAEFHSPIVVHVPPQSQSGQGAGLLPDPIVDQRTAHYRTDEHPDAKGPIDPWLVNSRTVPDERRIFCRGLNKYSNRRPGPTQLSQCQESDDRTGDRIWAAIVAGCLKLVAKIQRTDPGRLD